MRVNILGVSIDAVTEAEALERVRLFLAEPRGHAVFTPNPEMLVQARRRPLFLQALNSADLAVPDGSGLLWAARLQGQRLPERVTGIDLVEAVCEVAEETGDSVFLLGGKTGVAEQAAEVLRHKYPGLNIVGATDGGKVEYDEGGKPILDKDVLQQLQETQPTILFVAFGHGKQEEWITTHLKNLPAVRVAMGIGGSFDFIAGKLQRAPNWIRQVHLEWLWRLILQPWRIKRILTATVVFPLLVIGERLGIIKAETH